jgi:signal transduction histidine kinase
VHLQQVVLNLILNAMDAVSERPEEDRQVNVSAQPGENGCLEIMVRDTGTGIAPDKLSRIFEPFFTTKPNGMGMGLAISRTIVEAHGGKIRALNNPDRGAMFSFTIPLDEKSARQA